MYLFSWLVWDPNPIIFKIPFWQHPVTWYGVLFALGFLVGYFLIRRIFGVQLSLCKREEGEKSIKLQAITLTDHITVLVVLLGIIGARLGHIFFYDWLYYKEHPFDIIKIWEGGLASHGGAIGILIAICVFTLWHRREYPSFTFLATLDAIVIPAAFAGGCIRIGNFINQEILGVATDLPWGVIFMHPVEGARGIPLHPVQLYESLFYFLVFAFLLILWRKMDGRLGLGILAGWFFTLVFTFRFFIEYLKLPQSNLISEKALLNMGQILSLPMILFGLLLLATYKMHVKREK